MECCITDKQRHLTYATEPEILGFSDPIRHRYRIVMALLLSRFAVR